MKLFLIQAVLLVAMVTAVSARDNRLACKTRRDLAGSCRVVHGRLMAYNGTPSWRIWVIGTHRLLGIHEVDLNEEDIEHPLMPLTLHFDTGFDYTFFGDFEVCPLERQMPHTMQTVCVASARHIIRTRYRTTSMKGVPRF